MAGLFDSSKHPREPKGQHGGGEFAPENGGGSAFGTGPAITLAPGVKPDGGAQPATPGAGAEPAAAAAAVPPEGQDAKAALQILPPGRRKIAGAEPADADNEQGALMHRMTKVIAGSADDVVVMAVKSVMQNHPEWFGFLKRAAEVFKSVPGGDLAKFHDSQPRDADGRWTTGAVTATAAAAGGTGAALGARALVHHAGDVALDQARAAIAPLGRVKLANKARLARHAAAVDSIAAGLKSTRKKFLPTALRSLASQNRRAVADLNRHMAEHAEPFWPDPESEHPVWASTDPGGEAFLREEAERKAQELALLREKGQAPRSVKVAEAVHTPKVEQFERTVRTKPKVAWRNRPQIEQHIAASAEDFAGEGIRSLADLESMVLAMPRKLVGHVMHQYGLPTPRIIRPRVTQTVKNTKRVIPAHNRTIEGFPDQAGRKKLAQAVRADVENRTRDWLSAESPKAQARVSTAEMTALADGGLAAIRRLALLRAHGKAGIIGAGLLGAAAAGSAAFAGWRAMQSRPVEKLSKAADAPPPDPARAVYEAGADIEQGLAESLGATFARWANLPAKLLENQTAGLHGILASSLDRALAPLDDAAEGGAAAEVPVISEDSTGRNRIVGMSLDTGSDRVVRFSKDYRVKLAGQMADEQFQTLQTVLQDGTLNGRAPADTARLLRQCIGLTPMQAGYVLSYRRALQALDPNALNRALRDGRYDRTVAKAITTKTPLSEDQIDAMVSAYHRRSLALRAMTIARTEGVGAANNGHAVATQDFLDENPGFTVIKTWFSTEDEKTRPDHVAMNGQQVVGLYTPFVAPSGDRLQWPHDPNAAARQVCNCRCTFGVALVPRTAAAQRGFSLVADSPGEDADRAFA